MVLMLFNTIQRNWRFQKVKSSSKTESYERGRGREVQKLHRLAKLRKNNLIYTKIILYAQK